MKESIKRGIAYIMVVLTLICAIPTTGFIGQDSRFEANAATNGHTVQEALAWVRSQVGKHLDYDGMHGAQCVDLIKYYYAYLGCADYAMGNGCDYAYNTLPPGWNRYQGAQPQPGDILVYSGTSSNPNGHVAIYEADRITYHQNFDNKQFVVCVTYIPYNWSSNYWGVIRPDFATHTHSYQAKITTQATCTTAGVKTYSCSCGASYTESIPATNHANRYSSGASSATCTNDGYTAGVYCYDCQRWISGHEKINATGHDYGEWVEIKSATCTENGEWKRTCLSCGAFQPGETPALGHNYSTKWTIDKEETCTTSGSKSHHCIRCDAKSDVTTISATGHKDSNTDLICDICGYEFETVEIGSCGKKTKYKLYEDGTLVVSGTGDMENFASKTSPFYNKNNIKKVVIKSGITGIGDCAFRNCRELTDLIISDSVKSIGDNAFEGCISLKEVAVPHSVKSICGSAFYNCKSLKKITILNKNCSIENVSYTIYKDAVIYGHANSTAQTYAEKYGRSFKVYKCSHEKYITKVTGRATTSKNGTKITYCSICEKVKSKTTIARIKSITLSTKTYTYNGNTKKPTVTVKDSNGKKLKSGTDYTVKYSSGRKNVGTYTVTVTFKGNYSGTKKLTFKIVPKGTSISKLSAGSKKFTVTIKKQTKQTTGYQVQFSRYSNMNNAVTKTYAGMTRYTRTIKDLKPRTKYYVRVRTYKTVNGSKIYFSWSSVKSVRTK